MKKLLLILICLPIFYGCQQQVEEYNKSNVTTNDTLNNMTFTDDATSDYFTINNSEVYLLTFSASVSVDTNNTNISNLNTIKIVYLFIKKVHCLTCLLQYKEIFQNIKYFPECRFFLKSTITSRLSFQD